MQNPPVSRPVHALKSSRTRLTGSANLHKSAMINAPAYQLIKMIHAKAISETPIYHVFDIFEAISSTYTINRSVP
jgi:hypothetical protein